MTKGSEPASKPWPTKGTSRKDRARRTERIEEENVRTEGHATRMVQVACKRLYAQINANFRRGKKQYTRDDKFVQAKLYDIICDEARKLWSQNAVSMVRLNYKHDILANGPNGPADKGPPRVPIMMTWPWCKLALEVRRVTEKYHYSYQGVRDCFARMSYLVWMGGCHVGLVALFGTKEDMQKADLDLYCTPLGGESVVDIILAKDAMSLFKYEDTKGLNKAQIPWAYQKDLKVNCIMNKFEPKEGFCVRVFRVHPSRSGRFKEKFSDEDRLNKLYAEYAEYEDRQNVLERNDSDFPSGDTADATKFFSPDDIRKDIDKVDIYLQCGAWEHTRAHEEYKEILKRAEQPAAGEGDVIMMGERKMPGQDEEFKYLGERLQDRIKYTHHEVKPPPPPPETDDLYVAGPSPEAEAPSIEPTASPDEILAAYVATAGKPHQTGSLFESLPEPAVEAVEDPEVGITVQDFPERQSSVKARQRWRGIRPTLFADEPDDEPEDDVYTGGAATAAVHEWLRKKSAKGSVSFKGTVASRMTSRSRLTAGSSRSRGSVKYLPPKDAVTMGPQPEKYMTPEDGEEIEPGVADRPYDTRRSRISSISQLFDLEEPTTDEVVVQNTLPGSMKLSGEFTEGLNDPNSPEFLELAGATKAQLEESLAKELGDAFYSVQITGFKKGSVVAEFIVIMQDEADKGVQKDVTKAVKAAAKNSIAGRTIQPDSVDVKEPQQLKQLDVPVSAVPEEAADDEKKPKRKWSSKLKKPKLPKKSYAFNEIPDAAEEAPLQPQEDLGEEEPTSADVPPEEEPMEARPRALWKSLRMRHRPLPRQASQTLSGVSTDNSADESEPESEEPKGVDVTAPIVLNTPDSATAKMDEDVARSNLPAPQAVYLDPEKSSIMRDLAYGVEQQQPILLNTKGQQPQKEREEAAPVPVERVSSSLPSPEAICIDPDPDTGSIIKALTFGKEHRERIMLNTKSPRSPAEKEEQSPIPVKRVTSATRGKRPSESSDLPLPEAEYLQFQESDAASKDLSFGEEHVEKIMLNTKTRKEGSKKGTFLQKAPKIKLLGKKKSPSFSKKDKKEKKQPTTEAKDEHPPVEAIPAALAELPPEEDDDVFDPTIISLPIGPPGTPMEEAPGLDTAEIMDTLMKMKQQSADKLPKRRQKSVEFKEPEEPLEETAELMEVMEFGSSKKKKDSVKKDSVKKLSIKEAPKKSSMKKAKGDIKAVDASEVQTATLDLGDVPSEPRYEMAPYDPAMNVIEPDRDQGLFPSRGNFDSRPYDGVAEVLVEGDWEDHTQPPMETAPPADIPKNPMPRRVYAASDVSSMIATWSFDPEWGSIDLPPSEFDEDITPETKPTEMEASLVVARPPTPTRTMSVVSDVDDEISDVDSVSSDNTEDSRFSVVRAQLEPEDKEGMRVKMPGEIVAPVVAKTKKKQGDQVANGDAEKGCVVM